MLTGWRVSRCREACAAFVHVAWRGVSDNYELSDKDGAVKGGSAVGVVIMRRVMFECDGGAGVGVLGWVGRW
jgi:hypothetical protein